MTAFKRAERRKTWIKLAVTGPSGSGKTLSSLYLAFGLGGKVAVADTENGSASLYSAVGEYDACEIGAPFTVAKYVAAIQDAVRAGYSVLIIDSISHAWAGEGGLLAQKEALDDRERSNKFGNWRGITKQHEEMKSAILQAPIHIIATMRSKTDYVLETGAEGKNTPRKVGMAPIQREGTEYDYSIVWDLAANHSAIVSKDRTGLFDGMNARLTEEHGRQIAEWLSSATAPAPTEAPPRHVNRDTGEITEPPATPYADHTMQQSVAPGEPRESTPETRAEAEAAMRALLAEMAELRMWEVDALPMGRFTDYEFAEATEAKLRLDAKEGKKLIAHWRGELAKRQRPAGASEGEQASCEICGALLTKGQAAISAKAYARNLCPTHQKEAAKVAA